MAIKGRDLRIYLSTDGGTTMTPIAGERSCKMQVKIETKEIASAQNGTWKEFKAGRLGWTINCSGLLSDANLTNIARSRQVIYMRFYDQSTLEYYLGKCLIADAEQSGEVKGKATWSATLKGTGWLMAMEAKKYIETSTEHVWIPQGQLNQFFDIYSNTTWKID